MGPNQYPASVLTAMALVWLRAKYPYAVIVEELSVRDWGGARLDIAAITPSEIVGIEIKGDGDSPSRLKLQGFSYEASATRMWLLAAPSLQRKCHYHKPPGWGILEIDDIGNLFHSDWYGSDAWERFDGVNNAPGVLLRSLWKAELVAVGKRLGCNVDGTKGCEVIARIISETVPLCDLRKAVCGALYHRNWAKYDKAGVHMPARRQPT